MLHEASVYVIAAVSIVAARPVITLFNDHWIIIALCDCPRLLQDANLSSGAHDQALESVVAQLAHADAQLARAVEEHTRERTLLIERESALQLEKMHVSNGLVTAERQVAVEQGKVRDYQGSMQSLQKELKLLRNEHTDYKQRAAGILQVS